MAQVNTGRVVLGGLVAGVVINAVEIVMNMSVLADVNQSLMARLGLPATPSAGVMIGFLILGFVLGILVAWTYAAIRPMYGPGPKTAACAGLAVWIGAGFVPTMSYHFMGLYGAHYAAIGLAYSLCEMIIAALVAGTMYKEVDVPVGQAM